MIYRRLILAACLLCFASGACSIIKIRNPGQFLTAEEKRLLKRTTQTMDAGYGYDQEVELYYVFTFAFAEENMQKKEADFAEAVKAIDKSGALAFYATIYRINAMTVYKASWYKQWREKKYATYVKKYLLPPMEKYLALLQKYMVQAYPELEAEIPSVRTGVDREVQEYFETEQKKSPFPWG